MKEPRQLEVDEAQLNAVAQRLEQRCLEPEDYELLKVVIDTVGYLRRMIQQKGHSIQRLLRMIFGVRTEKTASIVPGHAATGGGTRPATAGKKKRKGHGRRGVGAYWGTETVCVPHSHLMSGDVCSACKKGKLFDTARPAVLLHLVAQPPITGKVFKLQQLRCALCGKLHGATPPPEAGTKKFAPNVAVTLAILRYGYGIPMNRIEQMQADCGVPLPAGTQWELIQEHALELAPVLKEYERQAAIGRILHNDDTTVRILELDKQIREMRANAADGEKLRTGIFTTGIIAQSPQHTIALFKSGGQHAGENLFNSRQVEPNSSLGKAINYMLKRWNKLTLFLSHPGAPLDNNVVERILKTAIRHRNNSLFYRTENGAHVGDLFMSLIVICRLARVNPFDYLSTLRRFAHRLRDGPAQWMPWNYKTTAATLDGN